MINTLAFYVRGKAMGIVSGSNLEFPNIGESVKLGRIVYKIIDKCFEFRQTENYCEVDIVEK